MEPYLRGVVVPMQDNVSDYENEMQPKLEELKESLHNLQKLQIKLKVPNFCQLHMHFVSSSNV